VRLETEAQKLRHDLQRYLYLLNVNSDPRAAKALAELISETDARLRAIANGDVIEDDGADGD